MVIFCQSNEKAANPAGGHAAAVMTGYIITCIFAIRFSIIR